MGFNTAEGDLRFSASAARPGHIATRRRAFCNTTGTQNTPLVLFALENQHGGGGNTALALLRCLATQPQLHTATGVAHS